MYRKVLHDNPTFRLWTKKNKQEAITLSQNNLCFVCTQIKGAVIKGEDYLLPDQCVYAVVVFFHIFLSV